VTWLSEGAIEAALEVSCDVCGMSAGWECVTVSQGIPLLEASGVPVHGKRLAPGPLNRYEQDLEAGGVQ
jgi:hypothetical protein